MRINELFTPHSVPLDELSYTDPGIRSHLIKSGYKPAGEGGDQTTYIGPDGSVLKIFGTHEGQAGFSADHKMFKFWADYCKKHSGNPYIPHYSDWASFEYPKDSGQQYLQIKMERLSEIPDEKVRLALDHLQFAIIRGQNFASAQAAMAAKVGMKIASQPPFNDTKLFDTLVDINKIGMKRGWGFDLHGDNYMMRGNQLVIVDPWTASS